MDILRRIPATLILIVVNCLVFVWARMSIGTAEDPLWTLGLMNRGALYAPYVLDGQWYRLFTQMFLHAHIWHLLANMYGLLSVGMQLEPEAGWKKIFVVYLITGVAGAFASMYMRLFTIGVGASGAIFGLFGLALIVNLQRAKDENAPIGPVIINFVIFIAINALLAEYLHADNYAHFGGALCGILIGIIYVLSKKSRSKLLGPELLLVPLMIAVFIFFPRYQRDYYYFFQDVLKAQDSTRYVMDHSDNKSNSEFVKDYGRVSVLWDSARSSLDRIERIPEGLQSDTMKLKRLIYWNRKEDIYRMTMVENESYIYADSIGVASDSLRQYTSLEYVLNMKYTPPDTAARSTPGPSLETVQVYYDSNWVEIGYPPAAYHRIGSRDSLGRWQGALADYYRNGNIQMKGSYKDDLKNGIFIYYSENNRYEAAGIYNNDQRVGKWETFHANGRIETEVYYRDRYFVKSYWDSTGVQMVKDGAGREIHRYPNGVIASEGAYVDGFQEGYWYGRHINGDMYFEENYNQGRLINGRSRSRSGRTFLYDATTLYALPEDGYPKLIEYFNREATKANATNSGSVKLSFRVTVDGQLTDFKVEQSLSKELDEKARQIVLAGPRWLPARLHGIEPTDGWAFVTINF